MSTLTEENALLDKSRCANPGRDRSRVSGPVRRFFVRFNIVSFGIPFTEFEGNSPVNLLFPKSQRVRLCKEPCKKSNEPPVDKKKTNDCVRYVHYFAKFYLILS